MNDKIRKLKSAISDLTNLIKNERHALTNRALDKVSGFVTRKEALLGEIDTATSTLSMDSISKALIDDLNAVRVQAEENAKLLKAMTDGVRQARLRLKEISELNFQTGVYQPDGDSIENPNASTIVAKA